NLKVQDLLSYAAALYKKDCSKRIEELTFRLNLDVIRKIRDLSFGNKKKVGIVAALLHSPKLLMLDEPTSGLDPLMQQTFFDILREENQKGVTILFSSHILSEVQKMCDRIAILKDGKVISLEEIETIRSNAYKKIILRMPEITELQSLDMEGVSNFEQNGVQINFLFKGDVNILLDSLRQHRLLDILIEEPSLEEIFMQYCKEGEVNFMSVVRYEVKQYKASIIIWALSLSLAIMFRLPMFSRVLTEDKSAVVSSLQDNPKMEAMGISAENFF